MYNNDEYNKENLFGSGMPEENRINLVPDYGNGMEVPPATSTAFETPSLHDVDESVRNELKSRTDHIGGPNPVTPDNIYQTEGIDSTVEEQASMPAVQSDTLESTPFGGRTEENVSEPANAEKHTANTSFQPTYPYTAQQEPKPEKKKSGGKGRLVAAALVVGLISGAVAGGGTSYLMQRQNAESSVVAGEQQISSTIKTTSASTPNNNISAVVENVSGSVVEVSTETKKTNVFIGEYVTGGAGSGVVLTEDGYIVTNDHVVDGASSIMVRTSDGTEYEAKLVGTDAQTDLAVIKVDTTGLKPVTLANSDEAVVGELAVVIGNPLGTLGGTVTAGIVSALDREITIGNQSMNLIQTSAAVNPGNSGGGLFDGNGDLLGVVNAKSSGNDIEGLGFAIPSNTVKTVTENIIKNGYVTGRPELGISVLEIQDEAEAMYYRVEEPGVYVAKTTRDNGLQAGDLLLKMDGKAVESFLDIQDVLESHAVGDTIAVDIKRDGKSMAVNVTLAEKLPDYMHERVNNSEKA